MNNKKVPLRRCVVSGEQLEKRSLIRVVRTPEGIAEIDLKGKVNGRGAYLKKDKTVIQKAKKTKILEKHLEVSIPDEIYDQLISLVESDEQSA